MDRQLQVSSLFMYLMKFFVKGKYFALDCECEISSSQQEDILRCAFLAEVNAWKDELNCASDEFAMGSPAVWIIVFSLPRPLVL